MGRKRRAHNLTSIARYAKALEPPPASAPEPVTAGSTQGPLGSGASENAAEPHADGVEERPLEKRRKVAGTGTEANDVALNDAELVPRYTSIDEVPQHLQKYEEGWYSVTPEKIALHIAERCRCDVVLDAFCGVGGNAIAFAQTCHHVIAMDISPVRLALARHNATIYGVLDRIEFILADYLDFARSLSPRVSGHRTIDVVFLSPPWGGPKYLGGSPQRQNGENEHDDPLPPSGYYSLDDIQPIPGDELFHLTRSITNNVAFYLPRTVDLEQVSNLVKQRSSNDENANLVNTQRVPEELVEVEENYMSGKLKAVTCYFGGLANGQEDMF